MATSFQYYNDNEQQFSSDSSLQFFPSNYSEDGSFDMGGSPGVPAGVQYTAAGGAEPSSTSFEDEPPLLEGRLF